MELSREEKYTFFVTRPSMYIFDLEKNTVEAFVNGFEQGNNEFFLTKKIQEFLEEKHKIKKRATGWTGQLDKYAEKNNITFFEAFKEIVLELFD